MKKKRRVALLFGGKSAEHKVSLQSACNIAQAINLNSYELTLIGLTKDGRWLWRGENAPSCGQESPAGTPFLRSLSGFLLNEADPRAICLNESALVPFDGGKEGFLAALKNRFDIVFPVLHGPWGEDGTVQGLLRMAGVPFAGSGVLGSALGMDKDIAKRLLAAAGIPVAASVTVHKGEKRLSFAEVTQKLGAELFIKPANMGSSVGVHKVRCADDWDGSLDDAFLYDGTVLVEECIDGREIECAVLGNGGEAIASCAGEIIPAHDFYTYEAKYLDENGARLEIPAKLPEETAGKIRELSVKTFLTLRCEDLARVDFFLKKDGSLLVNEINTMPGFTAISMYPKLWEESGIGYSELIDRIITGKLGQRSTD
jgi:D-alanine-D-alanine ligase